MKGEFKYIIINKKLNAVFDRLNKLEKLFDANGGANLNVFSIINSMKKTGAKKLEWEVGEHRVIAYMLNERQVRIDVKKVIE